MLSSFFRRHYSHTNSKGVTYWLFKTDVTLRGGKPHTIYFFSKSKNHDSEHQIKGKVIEATFLPYSRIIKENPRNGFLAVVRRDAK